MTYTAIFITAFLASVHCALMFSGFILAYSVKNERWTDKPRRKYMEKAFAV